MRLPLAPLLPLALSFGCIYACHIPDGEHPLLTSHLAIPPLTSDITYDYPDLVAYAKAQSVVGDNVPLVTPEFELKLLSDAAEEVKHLDIYDDNQRARLSLILEATRAIIKQRSGLPTTIHPDTDPTTLKKLAAQFEIAFLEYASLSNSPTWAKFCMAALLGKDTLIKLLPFLSEGFVKKTSRLMFDAAAVIGDFETLCALANYSKLSTDDLPWYLEGDALFSGSVEFVQQIVNFTPSVISYAEDWLKKTIKLNHRPLFDYLYAETMKQPPAQWNSRDRLTWTFVEIARRGWEDLFKQLYSKHPQFLNPGWCLMEAARHGRITILKYLLFQDAALAKKASLHLTSAFEAAVGSGHIDAINFLLDDDESGNPIIPNLSLTKPSPHILDRVSASGRWDGIQYLMQLKEKGDVRFVNFKLAGDASQAVNTACLRGNLQVLRRLRNKDSLEPSEFTFEHPKKLLQESLRQACYHGHLSIVQELLKHTNVNPAFNNQEALVAACARGNHLVVRELLQDNRVDADARNNQALIAACKKGQLLVLRELLQKRTEKSIYNVESAARDNEALIAACQNGNLLVVRELLQHARVEPGARGSEPLIAACRRGHLLVIQELLQRDDHGNYIYHVDPGARDNEALIAACNNANLLAVQELLQKDSDGTYIYAGINPAARNNQCLIDACKCGHLELVRCLLQRQPNIHGVMEYEHAGIDAAAQNNRALLEAVARIHFDIVEFLLQKTEQGDYVFPGIAITEQVRQIAALMACPRLQQLLEQ